MRRAIKFLAIYLVCILSLFGGALLFAQDSKVIDFSNWEHRYAIALAAGQARGWPSLIPIKKEDRDMAEMYCVKFSIMRGLSDILIPIAVGPAGILCMSPPEVMNRDNNTGWKEICALFNMEYVSNPYPDKVICTKRQEGVSA